VRPLASYGIPKGATPRLVPLEPPSPGASGGAGAPDTLPNGSPRLASPLHELHDDWQRARAGLEEGHAPRLAAAGTGGCYFLLDAAGAPVAVFKPQDEEAFAANNPKGRAAAAPGGKGSDAASWLVTAAPAAPAGSAAAAAARGGVVAGAWPPPAAPGEGLRRGLRPGEGAVREVAAYVLDHGHFAGVPATALVQLELGGGAGAGAGAKVGSLQQYVAAESDCEERGPSDFPTAEVHRIAVRRGRGGLGQGWGREAWLWRARRVRLRRRAPVCAAPSTWAITPRCPHRPRPCPPQILDLRLGNTDRNGGNILARRRAGSAAWELVPIDHGSCLPDSFEDLSFEWAWWPQAERPFSPEARKYIAALDADRDAAVLAAHGLSVRPECLRVLRVCTMLLQAGSSAGLTPAQIAGIAARQESDAPSPLEEMHAAAAALAAGPGDAGLDEAAYLSHMRRLVAALLEDFVLDNGGHPLL
jgi:hypothetical protein